MSRRSKKIAVLVLSGGILLQAAGCGSLLAQQVAGFVVNSIVSALISAIADAAATA